MFHDRKQKYDGTKRARLLLSTPVEASSLPTSCSCVLKSNRQIDAIHLFLNTVKMLPMNGAEVPLDLNNTNR